MRETKKESVGNKVASEVAFQDGRLLVSAVVGLADTISGVNFRSRVTQCQDDLAGHRHCVLMDVEQVLRVGRVEIFRDEQLGWFSAPLAEGVGRLVR